MICAKKVGVGGDLFKKTIQFFCKILIGEGGCALSDRFCFFAKLGEVTGAGANICKIILFLQNLGGGCCWDIFWGVVGKKRQF